MPHFMTTKEIALGESKKPTSDREFVTAKANQTELKPFVKWVGGKSRLIDSITKLFLNKKNELSKYAEPMVGGGALFFKVLSKNYFDRYYISDINSELINAFKVIQKNAEPLISKLSEIQATFLPMNEYTRKDFYYSIRDKFNNTTLSEITSVEKAAYFIFLNKTCFNGLYRVNKNGHFNVPMGKYKKPTICDAENLRNIHSALKKATIVCGDYVLSKSFIDDKTFVYLDPPYRPISNTSSFTSYNSEIFDNDEQIRLADFFSELNAVGAKIVLSNSDPKNTNEQDDFFDNLYKNYLIQRIQAKRMINSNASKRGSITELLIHN